MAKDSCYDAVRMRKKALILITVLVVVFGGGAIALELFKAPEPYERICEDGDNTCLFCKVLHLWKAYELDGEITDAEWDEIASRRMELCSRMTKAPKRDDCYGFVIESSSIDLDLVLQACEQIFHYVETYN